MTNKGYDELQLACYLAYPQHRASKTWVRLNMKLPYEHQRGGLTEKLTLKSTGRRKWDYHRISKFELCSPKVRKLF